MSEKIRVLTVDDHPFFRCGLTEWLNRQGEFTCCGEAESISQALSAIEKLKPDVVLVDLQLKDGDGLDLVTTLSQTNPLARVIILSHRDEAIYAHRALRAGARGYVMKTEATAAVKESIQAVMRGEIFVSRSVAARALQRLFPDPAASNSDLDRLSDREIQVFQLLGAGCSTREVSAKLKISPKTVETYREILKRKLHLADAEALVRTATHWVEYGTLGP